MPSYTPDACPDLSIQKSDVEFAKNLADWLVPSGRDRPRPEQQVVSLSEYNELMEGFQRMKKVVEGWKEKYSFVEADRDAACNIIGRLRREYNIPLTPDEIGSMVDEERDTILAERNRLS